MRLRRIPVLFDNLSVQKFQHDKSCLDTTDRCGTDVGFVSTRDHTCFPCGSCANLSGHVHRYEQLLAGTWRMESHGIWWCSIGDNVGEMFEAHVRIGHNLVEDLSINIELIGGYARMYDQSLDSSRAGRRTGS